MNGLLFKPLVEKYIHHEAVSHLSSEISFSSQVIWSAEKKWGPHEANSRLLSSMKTQQLQFPRAAGGSSLYLGWSAVLQGTYLDLGG